MTIKRRPRPQRRRQLTALALAIAIPWLVAVTAASEAADFAAELTAYGPDVTGSCLILPQA